MQGTYLVIATSAPKFFLSHLSPSSIFMFTASPLKSSREMFRKSDCMARCEVGLRIVMSMHRTLPFLVHANGGSHVLRNLHLGVCGRARSQAEGHRTNGREAESQNRSTAPVRVSDFVTTSQWEAAGSLRRIVQVCNDQISAKKGITRIDGGARTTHKVFKPPIGLHKSPPCSWKRTTTSDFFFSKFKYFIFEYFDPKNFFFW